MKKITIFLAASLFMMSCKNETASTDAKKDSTAYPYKASYSSDWSISTNPKNAQTVLQSYKDWEDDKLSNGNSYIADTLEIDSWNGDKMRLTKDSTLRLWQKGRDSLSSTKISVIAWTTLHSNDKNEDWVSLWYTQTDTYKSGKVDSAFFQDDNRIQDGKIVFISTKKQAMKK
jgi:secreted Zn-dependent insulinase-like peptidase